MIVVEGALMHGCFCGNTRRERAALTGERPPLILLIHVRVCVALMTHQIFSIMFVNAFILGLRKKHLEICALF